MGKDTDIQWCDSTVNPTANCDGCELWIPKRGIKRCYAGRMTERWKGMGAFDRGIKLFPGRTAAAAAWSDLRGQARADKPWIGKLPRLIFVSDMSDALSSGAQFKYLEREIITVAATAPGSRHIWIWLTKRPARMAEFSKWLLGHGVKWPANLWAMTSVTDQQTAESRIPWLMQVGDEDTIHGISAEPLWRMIELNKISAVKSCPLPELFTKVSVTGFPAASLIGTGAKAKLRISMVCVAGVCAPVGAAKVNDKAATAATRSAAVAKTAS